MLAYKIKPGLTRIKNIKNIIAVTSGKGGVGKSTVAINLALALSKKNNYKIGILDCDIYGPSLPILLGSEDFKPEVNNNQFVPLKKFGIEAMSFGFLIDRNQPAIWRGAIVTKAISQMLYDTKWDELDCLIIDMPPGTGDIHLTMAQKMPLTTYIVITTPQDIVLRDVKKSISMYNKLEIPCLGVVENMSYFICPNCNNHTHIFNKGSISILQDENQLPLLAKIPLNADISTSSDKGIPVVLNTSNENSLIYNQLADQILKQLAKLGKDNSSILSSIPIKKI